MGVTVVSVSIDIDGVSIFFLGDSGDHIRALGRG
jgi:hypothetical protein